MDWLSDIWGGVKKVASSVGDGLFDAAKGIMSWGKTAATEFGGGAFVAVDERLRGGTATTGAAAPLARRAGSAIGNLFSDIGTSYLTAQLKPGPIQTGEFQGPAIDPRTGEYRKPSATAITARPAVTSQPSFPFSPFEQALRQLQPAPVAAGFGGDLVSGIVGGAVSSGLEWLEGQLRADTGLIPGLGPGVANVFFGEEPMANGGAIALPGGAMLQQPVAPQAGRVFNVMQNLSTGQVRVVPRQTLRYMNPLTGKIERYERAVEYGIKVRGVKITPRPRCYRRKR